jgi:uncharacterized membrane protein
MVIHFPSALLVMDVVFSAIAVFMHHESLTLAAYYCLVAGVIGGWMAILSGLYDLFRHLAKDGNEALRTAVVHATLQTIMVFGFTFVLSAEYNNPAYIVETPTGLWIIKAVLIALMSIGNYYGGELLLRHIAKKYDHQCPGYGSDNRG